ncbi:MULTISPECIES: hypothetical protein [unclassified Rathayibacter]|uniref:hypothetical protein n=1 Tax=unclassified Rathayibacter TaxID=2609250 RepID=UPI001051D593|nr:MULTISPECIES: hypothetical protein [unclassified Rathayibacter]MCJ1703781.1 hypothetical protein [Rathayibacter sp. VKM Ac-2926]TCL82707.1 hypothetical protein EDF49_105261 [Rathayibacter sp. PhB192]TCM28046.1 hypothetical protein EDF43_105261 [Rathayibacter sp. PhB179]
MPDADTVSPTHTSRSSASEALKERIYVTFTALVVTVSSARDVDHASVRSAAVTLAVTVFGTLLAVFVADLTASMMTRGVLPRGAEIRHMLSVSFGSLRVIIAPVLILCVSASGALALPEALRLTAIVLVATLIVITLLAVLRVKAALGTKLLVLTGVGALSAAVLIVELSLH